MDDVSATPGSSRVPVTGSQWFGKRQRTSTTPKLPVISQDDDMCMEMEMEMDMDFFSCPVTKRARLSCHEENFALSSDVVSVSSDYNYCLNTTSASNEEETKPWWKKGQKLKNEASMQLLCDDTTRCFVCESIFTPRQVAHEPVNIMPTNSLLAYFPCKSAASSGIKQQKRAEEQQQTKRESCTFCERVACPSCTNECEECCQTFCTFCCTNEYYGSYARTVCLDCARQEEFDQGVGSTGMNVDI